MRFLVASWSLSGHLIPLVAPCRELIARGHEVTVVGDRAIDKWRSVLNGAEIVPLDFASLTDDPEVEEMRKGQAAREPMARATAAFTTFMAKSHAIMAEVVDVMERVRPNAVLRDYMFHAGWMAAIARGVPVATYAFAPIPPAFAASLFPDLFDRAFAAAGLSADVSLLDRWLTLYGMPLSWVGGTPLPPTSHLVQPSDLPTQDEAPVGELLAGLPDRPTVYASMGTAFGDDPGLWELVFDGVASVDVNVIATLGAGTDLSSVHAPDNVRCATFVPQAALLPHCDAVIAHGGYGTLMGALRCGLPAVSVPAGASDNVMNAMRLESLGAGRAVAAPDRSPADLTEALTDILGQPRYHDTATAIAAEIAALPPAEHGATLMERLARTGEPVVAAVS